MPTYKEVQRRVKEDTGRVVKTCWIADVKQRVGLKPRRAPNRDGIDRKDPCPPEFFEPIRKALESEL
jgi:hypothetical protein